MRLLLSLAAVLALFGLNSCCCMFSTFAGPETTEVTKKACGYDTVTEQVWVAGPTDPKSGMTSGEYRTVEHKVPRYKTVKKRQWCNNCWRFYCPDSACCGTTGKKTLGMASVQGWSGSPHVGLIPTMRPVGEWNKY